jgi:WD40 repeat protein
MSDQITDRPPSPNPSRPTPAPDEDALPRPARAGLPSVWEAKNLTPILGTGLGVGAFLTVFGVALATSCAGFPSWLVIAGAVLVFAVGMSVGVGIAVDLFRAKIGRGVRSNNRELPRGPLEVPGRPAPPSTAIRPSETGIASFPWTPRPAHAARLVGARGRVSAVALSADGRLGLSAAADRSVSLWDVGTGFELLAFYGFGGKVRGVALSPDGRLVAACGEEVDDWNRQGNGLPGVVRIWDAATGQELRRFEIKGRLWSLAFLPDRRHVAVGGADYLRLWEIDGPSPVAMVQLTRGFGGTEEARAVAVSPDGQMAVAGCHYSRDARLVNLDRGAEVRALTGHKMRFPMFRVAAVVSAAFSPDGMRLLTGSWDQTARVWNLAGDELARFDGHRGWWGWRGVVGVAWLDGRRAVSASENGLVCVWDTQTGEELARHHHGAGVTSLAATPDGRLALTGGRDGVVRVWEL